MRNAGNVDPVEGALEELQRVIGLIREKWPTTHILVRGDSAYAREEIEMENRIKEQQLDLFADRTSTQTFARNQLSLN